MSNLLLRKANEAFRAQDYAQAIQLYREAGVLLGSNLFAANISLCQIRYSKIQAEKAEHELRRSEYSDRIDSR